MREKGPPYAGCWSCCARGAVLVGFIGLAGLAGGSLGCCLIVCCWTAAGTGWLLL